MIETRNHLDSLSKVAKTRVKWFGRDSMEMSIDLKCLGCPILISRVLPTKIHLIDVGDVILAINHQSIIDWTHDEVIKKLRDPSMDQVQLTIRYSSSIAPYLYFTASRNRSSMPMSWNRTNKKHQNRFSEYYPTIETLTDRQVKQFDSRFHSFHFETL